MNHNALKLTTYFGERSYLNKRLLADELLDVYAQHAIQNSILLRGIQGFGAKHRRRSDRLLTLSEDLPLVSVAVDEPAKIEAMSRTLGTIGREGLITLERTCLNPKPDPSELLDASSNTLKLTLYLGRHERVNGLPAFVAICKALYDHDVAGATVLLGVDGTRYGERRRARFFAGNANVPLMIISVGPAQQIVDVLLHLEELLDERLLATLERVRLCKRDGMLIQHPSAELPQHDADFQQKLTIIISEAARHENTSMYLELIRRLRAAKGAGATSLRGIWGFHGDHLPHGDRLLAIRRHVPVLTIVIDSPTRIADLFPIVDELTHRRGLVTSELVPASSPLDAVPAL